MKTSDIIVGGFYTAKVSEKVVTVRVDKINWREGTAYNRGRTTYVVTNMATGRTLSFESAMRFRGPATQPKPKLKGPLMPEVKRFDQLTPAEQAQVKELVAAKAEGEKCPDPQVVSAPTVVPTTTTVATATTSSPGSPKTAPGINGLAAKYSKPVDDSPHLIVEARAGTGKTTTIIHGIKLLMGLPSDLTPSPQQKAVWDSICLSKGKAKTVCFVAFNKSIADELKSRVPAGCDAMTMHSMGFKAVLKAFGNVKVNAYRVSDVIGELTGQDTRELRRTKPVLMKATEELVDLCKMNLTDPTQDELKRLASHYDVEVNGSEAEVFELVPKVLDRCMLVNNDRCIDFGDMVWLPVALGLPMFRYDLLFVDEAQDLNRCQQALAKASGRRLVLVGDDRQAIYGFAGADSDSLPRMKRELGADPVGCVSIPLTVTRRCGKAIVEEAKAIVPDFEAFPTNPEGKVNRDGVETYMKQVQDRDMILCRVNAPLVSHCFRFIKAGRKANIQGRDVGQGLISTVNKVKAVTVAELITKLGGWLDSEVKKETAKKNPSESRLIAIQDRHDCLLCFTSGLPAGEHPDAVVRKIESVFTDNKEVAGIHLSSIHKAKGLEANRVFLLEPEGATVPHPMAKGEWQRHQEMNLRYVAITRAVTELIYVS